MKRQTITMSVKDARKAAKESPAERSYSFRTIAVDNIQENGNIRQVGDIDDLAASIQAHGIINPITVTNDFGMPTQYRVVAGHRRLAAAKRIGLAKVPCHVVDKDSEGLDEIQLSENVTRMDMTPYEECLAVKLLVSKKNTVQQVARKFGRTVRWVLVRKKLADAGDKVLEKVKEGAIGLDAAAKIADLPDNVFKRELESCYGTDKYFIDGVLYRYHKDLSHAPFEHEACLKCDNCSACQADLVENEPKAYCLDSDCWARKAKRAAEAKVKKLQEEGRNARLGKFSGKCISYEDEADKYEINSWDTKGQEQAKEAGIQKRILVDAATLKTLEYYDKRDLPDYHEMTEEEREALDRKRHEESRFNSVRTEIYEGRLSDRIASVVESEGNGPAIITILTFVDARDWFDDAAKEHFKLDEDLYGVEAEEIPDGTWDTEIAALVREHVSDILERFGKDSLEALYRMIIDDYSRKDLSKLMPTDEEVREEIARQDEMEAAESEHDEEKEGDDE